MKTRTATRTLIGALLCATSLSAFAQADSDINPPGRRGGPGTNWENRPGAQGGPGASPNRPPRRAEGRDMAQAGGMRPCPGGDGHSEGQGGQHRDGRMHRFENDNNPPGARGGAGSNWENRPGPQGGPGTSPNRASRFRPESGSGSSAEG